MSASWTLLLSSAVIGVFSLVIAAIGALIDHVMLACCLLLRLIAQLIR